MSHFYRKTTFYSFPVMLHLYNNGEFRYAVLTVARGKKRMKKRLLALLLAASMLLEPGAPALAAQPAESINTPAAEDTEVGSPEEEAEEIQPGTGKDAEDTEEPGAGEDAGAEDVEDTEEPGTDDEGEDTAQPGAGGDGEDTEEPSANDGEEAGNLPEADDSSDSVPEYIEESHEIPFEIGGTDVFAGIDESAEYAVDGASVSDAKYDPRDRKSVV